MSKFNRWLRSKSGRNTLIGVVAALLVVAVVGAALGWWVDLIDLLSGTVAPPLPTYPPPENGYTCLPSCFDGITDYDGNGSPEPQDGKFLSMPGENMASFGGESIILWISVPADYDSFELSLFDGDSGKDDGGAVNPPKGNWDDTDTQSTYTLYTDPMKDGPTDGEIEVGSWTGNDANATGGTYCSASSETMPNNDWYVITCSNADEARAPSGHYIYRFQATRPLANPGINAFKLRTNGYLSAGQSDLVDANFAIVGMLASLQDVPILYPEFTGNYANPGVSTYDGTWDFYFYVPQASPTETMKIEIWDGDFDRGTQRSARRGDVDTDDSNTEGIPDWASPFAVAERAGGRGNPADNYPSVLYRRDPPVRYTITDPAGEPIYTNEEPSGTEEWERYVISTDPNSQDPSLPVNERADEIADGIVPGWYGWRIEGLDLHNTVWIRFDYEAVPQPPPPPCDATCPRTIGYWKNNVKKVLIQGKDRGVQETPESIRTALYLVAQYSPLFRSGLDVNNPQSIAAVARLTDQEAHDILQKANGNSMLDRALQQNLASWLNLMSGKICPDTIVTLDATGGRFEGTAWQALQEAQDIILNASGPDDPALERAKDIGDLINNGLLGENADTSTCDDYTEVMPPDKQPPKHEDKPKAPKPDPVPQPIVGCTEPRTNQYGVEITDNPFQGIKFEYQSGTEVKDGDHDKFQIVLTAEQAAALTAIQMEAKAGQDVGSGTVSLEGCQFDQMADEMCATVQDENGNFSFSFAGAMPNEDGTLTLVFYIQNNTEHGLSHVTIGIVPDSPPGSYQSQVCR
jgi:hypothetical protein